MATDPDTRAQIAKTARLWGLSLLCATGGAIAVSVSQRIAVGIFVFGICLVVLGVPLYLYERRRRP